jgi:hypothetical protein
MVMTILINAYCTLRNPPGLIFPHVLNNRRSREDPELESHLEGFIGYVLSRGDQQMTRVKYHVMRHIQKVQHQFSVTVGIPHLDLFEEWAQTANAICYLPDGSVRDPFGRLLIDANGEPQEEGAEVPYPEDALARKIRSEQQLQRLDVQVLKSLPPVIAEVEAELRAAADTARRALALFVVALRAESLAAGAEIPPTEIKARLPLAFAGLSPKEESFLEIATPGEKLITNFGWRYEALLALLWALGLATELPDPTETCDASVLARAIMERGEQKLVAGAGLRPAVEILDALDLHFRLHWAIRQARLDGRRSPGGIDPSVVQERHLALNWLVRFEGADWDDVDTPT